MSGRAVATTVSLGVLGWLLAAPATPAGAATACFISPNRSFEVPAGGEFSFDPDPTHGNARWSGTITWGDGSAPEPFGNGDHAVVHRWTKAGTFTVTVTASGTTEGPDRQQVPCSNARTVLGAAHVTGPLAAAFRATASHGRTMTFDAGASSPAGQITSYTWTFGDGQGATGIRVTHTFAADRPYSVALTVADVDGQRAQAQRRVGVTNRAGADRGTPAATSSKGGASSPAAASKSSDSSGLPAGAIAAGVAGVLLLAAGAANEVQRRRAIVTGAADALVREAHSRLAWAEGFARSVTAGDPPRTESFGVRDPNQTDAKAFEESHYEIEFDESGTPHFVPSKSHSFSSVSVAEPG